MKPFLKQGLWFVLPLLPVLLFPPWVLFQSGEVRALDLNRVVAEQASARASLLYGPAYSDCTGRYKIKMAESRPPEVLALGTSRTMPFRGTFFSPGVDFYNAGGAVRNAFHLQPFLENQVRLRKPEILIVGLDQYFFNPRWGHYQTSWESEIAGDTCISAWSLFTDNWQTVYKDLVWRGVFQVSDLFRSANGMAIGLNAQVNGNGFRNDGSRRTAKLTLDSDSPAELRFHDALNRIRKGILRFEFSEEVAESALERVDSLVRYATAQGIRIFAFLPPIAPTVLTELRADPRHRYLEQLPERLSALFKNSDHRFFDFTDVTPLGSNDGEFTDGVHGGEKTYLRMFLKMAEESPALAALTSVSQLRESLASEEIAVVGALEVGSLLRQDRK